MANDRGDFAPEIRNTAWWSGDTRKAANGRANEAIMTKLGLIPIEDLSDLEHVQMGHVMQPIIGRLAENKLHIELKDADYALTHPRETWLKSHFDFISADGKTLVEAKNYNAGYRSRFDADANIIPAADMAQCIHEATVHNVNRVVLAVLFGGQNFETYDITVSDQQKEDLIKDMAVYWGHVKAKEPLPAETTQQTKLLYSTDDGSSISANLHVERVAQALKQVKLNIKALEEQEEAMLTAIQSHMMSHSQLISADGAVLATWKNSKASKRFNADLFKQAYPDLYSQFMTESVGSRRFLLK